MTPACICNLCIVKNWNINARCNTWVLMCYFCLTPDLIEICTWLMVIHCKMGSGATKPVFRKKKARLKPVISAAETSSKIVISPVASLYMILSKKRITKSLMRPPKTGFLALRPINTCMANMIRWCLIVASHLSSCSTQFTNNTVKNSKRVWSGNIKLQTNPWHREEEPHNNHETPGRQTKQSNQRSHPHQQLIKMIAKQEWTQSNAQQNIEQLQNPTKKVTINNESTTT